MHINNILTSALLILAVVTMFGCSKDNTIYYGYTFNDVEKINEKITHIQKHKTKKADVIRIFGTPTFEDENSFFYIENILVQRPFLGSKNIKNKILQVDFDKDNNVVKARFEVTNTEDNVMYAKQKTMVEGSNLTILEKFKSNIVNTNK